VAKFTNSSTQDAFVFAIVCSMNLFGENVESHDLLRFFDVTPFELMDYLKSLNTLSDRSILIKRKNRRRFEDALRKYHYVVNPKILDAIISEEPFPTEIESKITDVIEVLEKMHDACQECIAETIDTNDLHDEMEELIEGNKHFPLITTVKNLDLEPIDRIIYFFIIWKSVNGSMNIDMDEPLNSFFKRSSNRVQYMQGIFNGSNKLIKQNLVDYTSGRFFNDIDLSLSDSSLNLLKDHGVILHRRKNNNGTISPDSIAAKTLVYEAEESKQINELRTMMSTECYHDLMQRLKAKALPQNLNILLFGAPGTGKTETVYQLAKSSGREIMKVEISQSKSMWFGESEKLIKKIFRDYADLAKQNELTPILLFNEADAILSSRKTNNASAVSQTENAIQNILLEELENFKGIFIATTNLAENLDRAFDRRFLFKIKFNRPSVESRAAIWQDKMPSISPEDAIALSKDFELSGGQIDNVIRKAEIQMLLKNTTCTLEELKQFCAQEIILQKGFASIGFGKG
jgi:KaiC/GvpD/RAD55 family RecA-like ATPase